MNLKEALDAAPEGEMLFIGSRSSYMFIGNREEFEEIHEDIDKYYKAFFSKSYRKGKLELEMLLAKRRTEEVIREIEQRKRLVKVAKLRMEYTKTHPLMEREVGIISPIERGHQIIVDGFEEGSFWFKSEYEERADAMYRKKRLPKKPPILEE